MGLAWEEGGGGVRRGGVAEQGGDPGVGGGRGSVGGDLCPCQLPVSRVLFKRTKNI